MSNLSLVSILTESTAVHVSARIHYKKDKDAYLKAIRLCYAICRDSQDNLAQMKLRLSNLKEAASKVDSGFEVFANTKKYYMLGIDNVIDIIDSFINRFEKEFTSADEVFVETILEKNARENKSIF